jgi:dTDP-4-dehydrorhamnose reductase
MLRAAAEGEPIQTVRGDGRQLFDVSRLAKVVRLLTRTENPHPTYTCVDRDVLTWERIARRVVAASSSSSPVNVLPSEDAKPPPRFRTERVESLLGGPSSAEHAVAEHIGYLRSNPP